MLDGGEDVEEVVHQQGHFGIEKTGQLVVRKYYEDLQLLPIPIRRGKDTRHKLRFDPRRC